MDTFIQKNAAGFAVALFEKVELHDRIKNILFTFEAEAHTWLPIIVEY